MFSAKPTTVILLKAKGLEFYSAKEEEREILEFPPTILKKQEVVAWEKFEELTESFLARNSLGKQRAVMILGQDVLFEKVFPIPDDPEKEKEHEEKFFKEIPYKKEEVVTKRLKDESNIYLIATHKDFYQAIRYTLEKFGWTIERIVPVTLFDGLDQEKTLSLEEVREIISYVSSLKIGDFLTDINTADDFKKKEKTAIEQPSGEKKTSYMEKPKNTKNVFFFLVLMIAIAVLFFAALSMRFVQIPWALFGMKDITATPTPTPLPTNTPTPTPVPLSKEEASIKILNGTGTPGQAGKVKTIMTDLGFKTIETDNADSDTATETVVVFSSRIAADVRKEVIAALEKIFATVSEKVEDAPSSDILITTGEEK